MLLIKFYKLTTPYSGRCDTFFWPKPLEEKTAESCFYPDEYRVVDILRRYTSRACEEAWFQKKILVLAEGTSQVHPSVAELGEGGGDTLDLTTKVLREIDEASVDWSAESKEKEKEKEKENDLFEAGSLANTLILVPVAYGEGHSLGMAAMAIDVRKKVIFYLDSPGLDGAFCQAYQQLERALCMKGFFVQVTTNKMPAKGFADAATLTATLIQLSEMFLHQKQITVSTLPAITQLATQRLFQIYVNNQAWVEGGGVLAPESLPGDDILAGELMFADTDLWAVFLKEQAVAYPQTAMLLAIFEKQKQVIAELPSAWESDELAKEKVQLICDFQSKVIELVFLGEPALSVGLERLQGLNHLLDSSTLFERGDYAKALVRQDLLSTTLMLTIRQRLGIVCGAAGDNEAFNENSEKPVVKAAQTSFSSFRTRLTAVLNRYPTLFGGLKWLALGLVAATLLYFSGGLAVLPMLAEMGAGVILFVTPALACAQAILWHVFLKPLWLYCGSFRTPNAEEREPDSHVQRRSSQPRTDGVVLNKLKQAQVAANPSLFPEEKTGRGTEAKIAEASPYTPETMEQLIYAPYTSQRPAQGLRFSFIQNDATHSNFKAQLDQLILLKVQTGAPFACFIMKEPSTSQFVVGLLLERNLLIINPLGGCYENFYEQLSAFASARLIFSDTPLQHDPKSLASGPICLELLRHLSSLSREGLASGLRFARKSQGQHSRLRDHLILDLAHAGLLPLSLQGLLSAAPSSRYTARLDEIRAGQKALQRQHQDLLADPQASIYDERGLLSQLLLKEVTLASLDENPLFQNIQSRFVSPASSHPPQNSSLSLSPSL